MHVVHIQSWQHLSKVVVLAVTFLLSVVLNNVALQYIPVSFVEVTAFCHSLLVLMLLACWASTLTNIGMSVSHCSHKGLSKNLQTCSV